MPLGKRIDTSSKPEIVEKPQSTTENEAIDNTPTFTPFQAEEPKHSFKDIILNSATYNAIQDVLALYTKQDLIFKEWGLGERYKNRNQAGINLYGHSGTGKSMVAHAIACQLGRKLLSVDYSQIESKYVGETSKNLVAMFDYAKESEAIIFFDEADALLSKRVTNMSNASDVSVNQTRSVLLVLIDEFDDLILFASNFISNYDPAFIRRILAHIKFELPDEKSRNELWRMYIPQSLPTNADIKGLAAKYESISGSDISNAVFAASLRAARLNESAVEHIYFETAIENIIKSKDDNDNLGTLVSRRVVSEDYVKSQYGGELPK